MELVVSLRGDEWPALPLVNEHNRLRIFDELCR
jgi:hypothetical protein